MSRFQSTDYGPTFAPLVGVDRRRPLDAGKPNSAARSKLDRLTVDAAFAHAEVVDVDSARATLAAVWLLHDFLDESHAISQGVETASGSFWHGVMHRREGDYSNAKYWFRRTGGHSALERIAVAAEELGFADWDQFAFVDACERAVRSGDDQLCRRVQQAEWETLFDHCYRAAVR